MCTPPCNPSGGRAARKRIDLRTLFVAIALVAMSAPLPALESDREQPMEITAGYQKTQLASDDNQQGITLFRNDVRMHQGSLKIHAAEATVYQHPADARDAHGNDIGGTVSRVLLTGQPAHLEERQQAGGALVRADAERIDYDADTGVAVLSGNVSVVQQGRGEFRGPRMTYNTRTGEIESGARGADGEGGRVHLIIAPKAKSAAPRPAATDHGDKDRGGPA
ncbi:lipopolysaccharide transport periplasmic protein LptA [Dokdonella sp.]|uniref:lipopolysaccharide transport periplasmic protein LptA n=1 Tax=Dokdonella sp. TaxID=2291710 RepID=UPI0031C4C6FB|nr:lipopolysaccharide transport periplasmic protein LptA [Dokdonella sp.]